MKKLLARWLPLLVMALTLWAPGAAAQYYPLKLLKGYDAGSNLAPLYDSLLLPLLVTDNKVYVIRSECFPRAAGEADNDRSEGAAVNDRSREGGNNDRSEDGDGNDRSHDNDNNDRKAGGAINDRDNTGDENARQGDGDANNRAAGNAANDRAGNGHSNDRTAGGAATGIICWADEEGILNISFEYMAPDKKAQLYFNHKYYTSHSKRFKLKKS